MPDSALVLLFVIGPAAAVVLAIVLRRLSGGSATRLVLGAVLAVAALYGLAVLAFATNFRDAAGFIDCWPSCTPFQDAVGLVVTWGAILLAVFAVVELAWLIAVSARTRNAS